jgi:uncharacterized protein (TIGR03435 family)
LTGCSTIAGILACILPAALVGEPSQAALVFESASVKASGSVAGNDGTITTDAARFVARNVTLKRLIHEAWHVPYAQIAGPSWLDRAEYDIEATTANPVPATQLSLMLQTLLTERFKLVVHNQREQRRVYVLTAVKGRLTPRAAKEGDKPGLWRFHGDFTEFADVLSVQLTIPLSLTSDPSIPSHAAGAAVPVVNQTRIEGVHDISLDIRPERGAQADESVVRQNESGDTFTVWQRALREQLGLRLESRKAGVDVLVISHADRIPAGN